MSKTLSWLDAKDAPRDGTMCVLLVGNTSWGATCGYFDKTHGLWVVSPDSVSGTACIPDRRVRGYLPLPEDEEPYYLDNSPPPDAVYILKAQDRLSY